MKTKRRSKAGSKETPPKASVEQAISFLGFFLAASAHLKTSGKKLQLDDDYQWEIWRACRYVANQADNRLAGLLAAPALAAISVIDELIWKTEPGLPSKTVSEEQRSQIAKLADQLDFALALIYRDLGHLISWRGRHTRNSELFAEALNKAKGDGAQAARLIRRCPRFFPDEIAAEPENAVDRFA